MRVIKIQRIVSKTAAANRRRPFRKIARDFFARENHFESVIEALVFATLFAISAWPIVEAANAINQLL